MTQPTAPAGQSSALAPISNPPAQGQPAQQGQPPAGTPAPPPAPQGQPGWPQPTPTPTYQQPPVQYVPIMPVPSTVTAPPQQDGDGPNGEGEGQQDLSRLPQWVQKQITQLREENAKRRVSERGAVVNQHAWVAAQQMGVNGQALFGSLAWQKAVEQLDPSKSDFGRHLAETIWKTVQENPWMATQPAQPQTQPITGQPPTGQPGQQPPTGQQQGQPAVPGAPGQPQPPPYGPYGQPMPYPSAPAGYPPAPPGWPPRPPAPPTSGAEFTAGNTAGAPITEAQLAQMTPDQITEAMEQGRLKHLL